jgi:hypothetical protein
MYTYIVLRRTHARSRRAFNRGTVEPHRQGQTTLGRPKGGAPTTRGRLHYSYITRVHVSPALGGVKLKDLTPAHVRGFYGEKTRSNLAVATERRYV